MTIFEQVYIKFEWFSIRTIRTTDGTLTGTTGPGQRRPKSNANERVLHNFERIGANGYKRVFHRIGASPSVAI